AVRLLAPPKEDEKQGDFIDKLRDELRILFAAQKVHLAEHIRRLHKLREKFDNEDQFKAFLQQMYPEPTDPQEKELSELMGEAILAMAEELLPGATNQK